MAIFLACKHKVINWDCYKCNKNLHKCKYCGDVTDSGYEIVKQKEIIAVCQSEDCDIQFKLEFFKTIETERKGK